MHIVARSEKLELKKHVATVHCSNTLSLLERKLANALLYHAYPKLIENDFHEIHIPYLSKLVRYNSKDFKRLKKALIRLIGIVIEWDVINIHSNEQPVWNASSFISSASIKGSWCIYSYSKQMRDLLFQPDFYARLDMKILSKFKSSYGLALYETCARYCGVKKTKRMSLAVFRKLMGIEDGKYMIFRDLKRRVLDKAILEVNTYSDLDVTANIQKGSTRGLIKSIQFEISKKLKSSVVPLNVEAPNSVDKKDDSLQNILLCRFGFSKEGANKIISLYTKEKILSKIEMIESSTSYQAGKIKNLAAYLTHALRDDYTDSPSAIKQLKKIKKTQMADQRKRLEKIEEYRRRQVDLIFCNYKKLSDKEKKSFFKLFSSYIENTMYANHFSKVGLDDPVIKDKICDFVRGEGKNILNGKLSSGVISFSEFFKENN